MVLSRNAWVSWLLVRQCRVPCAYDLMSSNETTEEALEPSKRRDSCDSSSQISSCISPEMGQATLSYYVPRVFHKFICKSNLIGELPCRLKFSRGKTQNIRIMAGSQDTIDGVISRITDIVATTRSKLRPSHFICLPVQDSLSIENFRVFKSKVLEEAKENPLYKGIDEDLFTSECRLHITFTTLLLADQKEVEKASNLLVDFFTKSEVGKHLPTSPLCITIRGLMSMQTCSNHSHVLYATVQKDGDYERLQAIANAIADLYRKHGLRSGAVETPKTEADVKLHMTLMNSRSRLEKQRRRARGSERRRLKRHHFNATGLLTEFKDECFTEGVVFDTISLCRMHSTDAGVFYTTEAQLKLTEPDPETVA